MEFRDLIFTRFYGITFIHLFILLALIIYYWLIRRRTSYYFIIITTAVTLLFVICMAYSSYRIVELIEYDLVTSLPRNIRDVQMLFLNGGISYYPFLIWESILTGAGSFMVIAEIIRIQRSQSVESI